MLHVALKEWAIVCDLLLEGSLALLLRKGGIHEAAGPGAFELEHPRFALFPSWAHQRPEMIRPPLRDRVRVLSEPDEVTFRGIGEAARIWEVTDRAALAERGPLADLHPWTQAQIDMRFDYRPENPLYLLAVRVSRLTSPATVPNLREYAGCKSWVPLRPEHAVDDAGAAPVLDDKAFARVVERVEAVLGRRPGDGS